MPEQVEGDDRRRDDCRGRAVSAADLSGAAAVEGPRGGANRAGNRRLEYSHYVSLVLLSLFNPLLQSLRGLQQASDLRKVQRILNCSRASLGSLSEAGHVFDPAVMQPLIQEKLEGLSSRETSARRETPARRREHPAAAFDEAHRSGRHDPAAVAADHRGQPQPTRPARLETAHAVQRVSRRARGRGADGRPRPERVGRTHRPRVAAQVRSAVCDGLRVREVRPVQPDRGPTEQLCLPCAGATAATIRTAAAQPGGDRRGRGGRRPGATGSAPRAAPRHCLIRCGGSSSRALFRAVAAPIVPPAIRSSS